MSRPTQAIINLSALQHNLGQVQTLAPNSKVMAMVKANAYGHGAVDVAKALCSAPQPVDSLGVACLEEALQLRLAGIKAPICLLEGVLTTDELAEAAAYQLEVVVHQTEQVKQLRNAELPNALTVWLKVDTGMHRLGLEPEQVPETLMALQASDSVTDIRLLTHFASANELDNNFTHDQAERFWQTLARAHAGDYPASLANSAAIMTAPDTHADWVRPGLMLYGISPLGHPHGDLKPVMELRSELIAVKQISAGESVGYNQTWRAERDSRIGIVAIGYGDGFPFRLNTGTPVDINGHLGLVVGSVSMDMIAVDLTGLPVGQLGEPVRLWGPGLPVENHAVRAGTNPYELVCGVAPRVPRVYSWT